MTGNSPMGKKILFADDNPINREMVKIILANFDFDVTTAENGRQVLDILKTDSDFDLIILDINMPELTGLETAESIRSSQNSHINKIPIAALTGNETKSEINSIFNAGINSYIAKPATPEALMKVIKKTLENPGYSNRTDNSDKQDNNINPAVPDQDEIDVETGVFYVGNDFNIFKKLLLRFYKNYTGYTDKIKKFIENKELKNLKFAVHNLKGVSAQICANKLNRETKEIEHLLKEAPELLSMETIIPLETHFNKTMDAIEKILAAELETVSDFKSDAVQQTPPQMLKKNLLRLATSLKQKKTDETEKIISEINQSGLNENHRKILNEIKIFTKNHDFESALLRVKNFLKLI